MCQSNAPSSHDLTKICFTGGGAAAAAAAVSCRGRVPSLASFGASESGNAYKGWISGALALPAAGYPYTLFPMNIFKWYVDVVHFVGNIKEIVFCLCWVNYLLVWHFQYFPTKWSIRNSSQYLNHELVYNADAICHTC